jgi:Flp pilus assembly protein TadG
MMKLLRRFSVSSHGGIVPMAAAAIPMIALLTIAATEMAAVHSDKTHLQDVADAVALDAANQLTLVSNLGVPERAEASAREQLKALAARSIGLEIKAELVNDETAVRVMLESRRTSFFGNMLPPGGFVTRAEATALRMPTVPLCVLSHQTSSNTLKLDDRAQLTAPDCLVHSNNEIRVEDAALLSASLVQAVQSAEGRINPEALVGAERVNDPFARLPITFPARCEGRVGRLRRTGLLSLRSNCYDEPIVVGDGETLQLAPGEYYFRNGGLSIVGTGALVGTDVVLFFDKNSKLEVKDQARISLEGRRTKEWAGFLLVAARDNTNDFVIWADNVEKLLGTVYLPSARLLIDGSTKVAAQSDWTVVVAEEVEVKGSATLVINAKYARSGVPVPPGVGDRTITSRNVRLTR